MEIYSLQSTEGTSKFTYIGHCRRSIFDFVFFFNLKSFIGKQSDNHTLTLMLGLNYFLLFFFLSTNKFIVEAQLAHLQVRLGSDVILAECPKLRKMVD